MMLSVRDELNHRVKQNSWLLSTYLITEMPIVVISIDKFSRKYFTQETKTIWYKIPSYEGGYDLGEKFREDKIKLDFVSIIAHIANDGLKKDYLCYVTIDKSKNMMMAQQKITRGVLGRINPITNIIVLTNQDKIKKTDLGIVASGIIDGYNDEKSNLHTSNK